MEQPSSEIAPSVNHDSDDEGDEPDGQDSTDPGATSDDEAVTEEIADAFR